MSKVFKYVIRRVPHASVSFVETPFGRLKDWLHFPTDLDRCSAFTVPKTPTDEILRDLAGLRLFLANVSGLSKSIQRIEFKANETHRRRQTSQKIWGVGHQASAHHKKAAVSLARGSCVHKVQQRIGVSSLRASPAIAFIPSKQPRRQIPSY